MCLAIPMRIKSVVDSTKGRAQVNDVIYDIDLSLIENPQAGEYVIVHAGFAIERLDEAEANARLELFKTIASSCENSSS